MERRSLRAKAPYHQRARSTPSPGLHPTRIVERTRIDRAPDVRVVLHHDGFEEAFRDGDELMDMPELLPRHLKEFARLRDTQHADGAVHLLADRLDREHGSLDPTDDGTMVPVHATAPAARAAA